MDLNQFLNTFNLITFLSLGIKLFGIVASIFYLLFSLVVLKQVEVMRKTIEIHDHGLLLLAAFIQLLMAGVLIFFSLFVL
jgi:hypothetical protein